MYVEDNVSCSPNARFVKPRRHATTDRYSQKLNPRLQKAQVAMTPLMIAILFPLFKVAPTF
jgi:hypothetical protein